MVEFASHQGQLPKGIIWCHLLVSSKYNFHVQAMSEESCMFNHAQNYLYRSRTCILRLNCLFQSVQNFFHAVQMYKQFSPAIFLYSQNQLDTTWPNYQYKRLPNIIIGYSGLKHRNLKRITGNCKW